MVSVILFPSQYPMAHVCFQINTFNGTTAPTLRSSLTAALSQTMGYIDNLQGLIAESQDIPEETNTFRDEVKDAVGLYGNVTDETLMKRVEYLLIQGG